MDKFNGFFSTMKIGRMMREVWMVLVVVLMAAGVQGQGWMKTYGGEGDQGVANNFYRNQTACPTLDGGIFLATTTTVPDSTLFLLFKTDLLGNVLLEKKLPGNSNWSHPQGSKLLPNGDFLICGQVNGGRYLARFDADLDLIWERKYAPIPTLPEGGMLTSISLTPDGGIACSGYIEGPDGSIALITKFDGSGQELWTHEYFSPFAFNLASGFDFTLTNDNGFFMTGNGTDITGIREGLLMVKTNANGEEEWLKIDTLSVTGTIIGSYLGNSITVANDGNYVIAGEARSALTFPTCRKITPLGDLIWEKTYQPSFGDDTYIHDILAVPDGYYLLGHTYHNGNSDILIIHIDEDGNEIWTKFIGTDKAETGTNFLQTSNSSLVICGSAERDSTGWDALLLKTDSLGNLFSSALTGTVHLDPQNDCLPDPTETGLKGWLVQAQGNLSFATLTDTAGFFTMPVDTGDYTLIVTPPGPYWDVCNSPVNVSVTAFYDTTYFDFPVAADQFCPYLEVSITAPFLRRCFESTYYVHYCNEGTADAGNAFVEVTLDP